MIQSDSIETIEIDSNKQLIFDLYLSKLKIHNNIESSDQTILHMLNFNMQTFMLIFNISFEFKNDIVTFISFNQLLIKIKIIQQNNNIKLKSLNKSSMNIVFQVIKIFVNFNVFNIIFEKIKCIKK